MALSISRPSQLPEIAEIAQTPVAPQPLGRPRYRPRPLLETPESTYLQYLPAIYRQDYFMRRLLLMFESVLGPVERMVDVLPLYTEAEMVPEEFLPWLSHWVMVSLDRSWPLERQRTLIRHAVEIYRWRGTARGLKLHLRAYTGVEPLVQEHHDGFVLGADTGLGWTTTLVDGPGNPILFVVTIPAPDPDLIDMEVVQAIIDEDKPAHTVYQVRVVRVHPPEQQPRRRTRRQLALPAPGHDRDDIRGLTRS